ncbi:MAG: hypothetical protein M3457_20375, partial [Chloroflexota bacterium]|nr:hypothetical protein [Chloroflexota bacterium]
SSVAWDPWEIARVNTDPKTLGRWQEHFETGAMTMYTSDGNPASVAVPNHLPRDIADDFDAEIITSEGRSLLRYDPLSADE